MEEEEEEEEEEEGEGVEKDRNGDRDGKGKGGNGNGNGRQRNRCLRSPTVERRSGGNLNNVPYGTGIGKYFKSEGAAREWSTVAILIVFFIS